MNDTIEYLVGAIRDVRTLISSLEASGQPCEHARGRLYAYTAVLERLQSKSQSRVSFVREY